MLSIELLAVVLYLILLSVMDLRHQVLSLRLLIVGGIILLIIKTVLGEYDLWSFILGICVGIMFLTISKVTKEKIGYGDSITIAILAIFTDGMVAMTSVMLGCLLVLPFSLISRWSKNKRVAFIPFLTVGFVTAAYMWGRI
ncbi:MAG: prepilin peptidase [Suipraeoptans sp.]